MSLVITRMVRVEGSRVAQRRPPGFITWSDHPTGISRADWDAAAYEAAVLGTFTRLRGNPVARIVLDELARPTTIIPFHDQAGGNAFGYGLRARGGTPQGERLHYCSDVENTPQDETGEPIPGAGRGTGVGSSAFVEFTPGHWAGANQAGQDPLAPWADEVLLHELMHALEATRGVSRCVGVGFGYHTFAEFVAISVSNVYRSHYHRPQRNSHEGVRLNPRPNPVPPLRSQGEERMLRDFYSFMPVFFDRMASLDAVLAPANIFRHAARRGVVPQVDTPGGGPPRSSRRSLPNH